MNWCESCGHEKVSRRARGRAGDRARALGRVAGAAGEPGDEGDRVVAQGRRCLLARDAEPAKAPASIGTRAISTRSGESRRCRHGCASRSRVSSRNARRRQTLRRVPETRTDGDFCRARSRSRITSRSSSAVFITNDRTRRRGVSSRRARRRCSRNPAPPKREIIEYQQHQIETVNAGHFALATVYDRNWFFASNDLRSLKALLDRLDRRTAGADSRFVARERSVHQRGRKISRRITTGCFSSIRQPFLEKLLPVLAMAGSVAGRGAMAADEASAQCRRQPRFHRGQNARGPVCRHAASGRGGENQPLFARARRAKDTFLYSRFAQPLAGAMANGQRSPAPALPAFLQPISAALRQAGSHAERFRAPLSEMRWRSSARGRADSHWPVFTMSLPVRDAARARKIADAVATGAARRARHGHERRKRASPIT